MSDRRRPFGGADGCTAPVVVARALNVPETGTCKLAVSAMELTLCRMDFGSRRRIRGASRRSFSAQGNEFRRASGGFCLAAIGSFPCATGVFSLAVGSAGILNDDLDVGLEGPAAEGERAQ